jgi:16S rRNA (guanine966-N2)-methyltransferase
VPADHALLVESDRSARRAIETNLATCGFQDRADVSAGPAERVVQAATRAGQSFDLAFCDPPYDFGGWAELLGSLPAELIVIESGAPVAMPEGCTIVREARYGAAWVGFVERLQHQHD